MTCFQFDLLTSPLTKLTIYELLYLQVDLFDKQTCFAPVEAVDFFYLLNHLTANSQHSLRMRMKICDLVEVEVLIPFLFLILVTTPACGHPSYGGEFRRERFHGYSY